MDLLLLVFGAFVLIIIMMGGYYYYVGGYRIKIRKLINQNHALQVQVNDLTEELNILRNQGQAMKIRMENCTESTSPFSSSDSMYESSVEDMPDAPTPTAAYAPPPTATAAPRSTHTDPADNATIERASLALMQKLLRDNVVTPEQIKRAEKYRVQTKSDYPLEEVMILLDMLNPNVLSKYK